MERLYNFTTTKLIYYHHMTKCSNLAKSKLHLITAYKVALIQKPIDEINSNLPILENECLEIFKKRYKVFTYSNGALAVTLIGFFMNITC